LAVIVSCASPGRVSRRLVRSSIRTGTASSSCAGYQNVRGIGLHLHVRDGAAFDDFFGRVLELEASPRARFI